MSDPTNEQVIAWEEFSEVAGPAADFYGGLLNELAVNSGSNEVKLSDVMNLLDSTDADSHSNLLKSSYQKFIDSGAKISQFAHFGIASYLIDAMNVFDKVNSESDGFDKLSTFSREVGKIFFGSLSTRSAIAFAGLFFAAPKLLTGIAILAFGVALGYFASVLYDAVADKLGVITLNNSDVIDGWFETIENNGYAVVEAISGLGLQNRVVIDNGSSEILIDSDDEDFIKDVYISSINSDGNYLKIQFRSKGYNISVLDSEVYLTNNIRVISPESFLTSSILIKPGELINMPNSDFYTVLSGDTIWDIAKANNLSVKDIVMSNPWLIDEKRVVFKENKVLIPEGESIDLSGDINHDLLLLGNEFDNFIKDANGGDDTLNGGGGADILIGGRGYDKFYVDLKDTVVIDDPKGRVYINLDGIGEVVLSGGTREINDPVGIYTSSDGDFFYRVAGADVYVSVDDPSIDPTAAALKLERFSNGALGIFLDTKRNDGPPPEDPPVYDPNDIWIPIDPLVLDLNGDGSISSINIASSSAYFDLDGDGFAEKVGWIAPSDGILVNDSNGDGIVGGIDEVFGNSEKDGFTELREVADSNYDGVINKLDSFYNSILVWRDDGDGVSQPGELTTLNDEGVTEINLKSTAVEEIINGNIISAKSNVVINGINHLIVDINLQLDGTITVDNPTHIVNTDSFENLPNLAIGLPALRGFGRVKDLHISYSENINLMMLVDELVQEGKDITVSRFDEFLEEWSGLSRIVSSGIEVDNWSSIYKKIWILEKFSGFESLSPEIESSYFMGSSPRTRSLNYSVINERYNVLKMNIQARFLIQAFYSEVFQGSLFSLSSNRFEVHDSQLLKNNIVDFLNNQSNPHELYKFYALYSAVRGQLLLDETGMLVDLSNSTAKMVLEKIITSDYSIFWESFKSNNTANESREGAFVASENDAVIFTAGGDDIIFGGLGNDYLSGGVGSDTYYWGVGQGSDLIDNNDIYGAPGSTVDTIVFGQGLIPEDLTFKRNITGNRSLNGRHLIVTITSTGEQLTINNYFMAADVNGLLLPYGSSGFVDRFLFSDGTILTDEGVHSYELLATDGTDVLFGDYRPDIIDGMDGLDVIYGNGGDDKITGSGGNDSLYGGEGNDIYYWGAGDGNDKIIDNEGNDFDTIYIKGDLSKGDFTFTQYQRLDIDLKISCLVTNETIVVKNFFENWVLGESIKRIYFESDDSELLVDEIISLAFKNIFTEGDDKVAGFVSKDIMDGLAGDDRLYGHGGGDSLYGSEGNDVIFGDEGNDFLDGGLGNDTLYGGIGDDLLVGGSGDDRLEGGKGEDTYHWSPGDGNDYIFNYNIDEKIDLVVINVSSPNLLNFSRIKTNNLLITYLETLETIEINRFFYGDSVNNHFSFEIEGHAVLSSYDILSLLNSPTAMNDNLMGSDGIDVINGLAGDDWIKGRGGNDTLIGGAGGDIIYAGSGSDWVVGGLGEDTLYGNEGHDILIGGESSDRLYGHEGDDKLYGGAGDDFLSGGLGSDFYLWGQESLLASDQIFDDDKNNLDSVMLNGYAATDKLTFNSGLHGHLELTEVITGSTLLIHNYFSNPDKWDITFSTGEVINREDIAILSLQGTLHDDTIIGHITDDTIAGLVGNDYIDARLGNDTIIGGLGDDTLSGDQGNDSYFYSIGDGKDTILELNGEDAIYIKSQVNPDDIIVHRQWFNLCLYFPDASDTITIKNFFYGSDYQVEKVVFNNNFEWSMSDLIEMSSKPTDRDDYLQGNVADNMIDGLAGNDRIDGLAGNDVLIGGLGIDKISGGDGNDIIYGGPGNLDWIDGGPGNDVYLYGKGDGNQEINSDWAGAPGFDILKFIDGVQPSDIILKAFGDSLELSFKEDQASTAFGLAKNRITIKNFWGGEKNDEKVSEIHFSDTRDVWSQDNVLGRQSVGSNADDILSGNDSHNVLMAHNGSDSIYGMGGDDSLFGNHGNDHLYGEEGNDFMAGGRGDDNYHYLVSEFSGHDRIDNYSSSWGSDHDVLTLEKASKDAVWFTQDGDDLLVELVGEEGSIVVEDWFSPSDAPAGAAKLDEFRAVNDDGSALSLAAQSAEFDLLVSAMAAFPDKSAIVGGNGLAPIDQNLGDALAAAWQPS